MLSFFVLMRGRYKTLVIVAILALDLGGTAWGWYATREYEVAFDRERFVKKVEQAKADITKRMLDHELILRAGRGLFTASDSVTRHEWATFVRSLELSKYLPGIQGVGFARALAPEEKDEFVAEVRAEGFPEFRIWPAGDRDVYTSILYLEPFAKRNLRAFGYDMYSEPVRRSAMKLAWDSGIPAVSGKVTLVQETEQDVQNGVLMYLPIYRDTATSDSPSKLRANLLGFVYSPYRMNDLMEGILGTGTPEIDLEIYDGDTIDSAALLYDENHSLHTTRSRVPMFTRIEPIDLYGRRWALHFETNPEFEAGIDRRSSLLVLAIGSIVTLLVGIHLIHVHRERTREKALLAASRDATVGRMAATVAHEVNNPLAAIKGLLELLREDLPAGSDARKDAADIEAQIDRIARTVRALLGFARQRAAKSGGAPTGEILRAVAALFDESMRAKGINLIAEISEGLPPVALQPDALQDIVINLLENAREALAKGTIWLAARRIGGMVEILVEDDGPGLGPNPELLFYPFRTFKPNGTGLGLAIVRQSCEACGGRIRGENRPEGGARFHVVLPVAGGRE